MKRILSAFWLFALTTGAVQVAAQVHPFRDGTPGVIGYRSEVLALVMIQESEFTRLAEAIPAEKYTWRPGLGVENFEQSTTDKTKIIAMLKESYAHAKKAITDLPDANLEKTMDWAGGKITYRGMLLYIVPHIAEHLGQLIAYARINGVVPPWSEDAKK